MGTIRKQSVLGTIFTYLGAIVGFITTGLLFPKFLSTDQIGLLSILVSYSMVFATIANLGIPNIIIRFFPYFRSKENKNNGLLFLSIIIPLIGFGITSLIFILLQNQLIENAIEGKELLQKYIMYFIPMIFVTLYFNVFDAFYRALFNVVLGTFLKEFLQRIIILAAIVLFALSYIGFNTFVSLYVLAFTIPMVALILALIRIKEFSLKPNMKFLKKPLARSMTSMGLFGIISAFSGIVILNVDRIMLERLLGLSDTGIYTIAFFFGSLILMPSRPLLKISSAFIAEAWKNNDTNLIKTIYAKSSINQLIIGLLLLIGIWCNIHNIFKILPEEYIASKYVILFIGLSALVDMASGTNAAILVNSRYFKMQTYFMLVLIILAIGTNFIFIPIMGMTGAALASLISKIAAHTARIIYIWKKLKMFPFRLKHLVVLIIGGMVYSTQLLLPYIDNLVLDITLRSTIVSVLFLGIIYSLKISDDINTYIKQIVFKIFKRHI